MAATTTQIEERLSALEEEVAQLKAKSMTEPVRQSERWWHKIAGTFADNPDFEEAMRLGREWRESQNKIEP